MPQIQTKKTNELSEAVAKENIAPKLEFISKRRFVRNTPDKIRLAATLVRGKKYNFALGVLKYSALAAAKPLLLTLKAAKAIAKEKDIPEENLLVKEIRIDEGPKLKRRRIIPRGRATAILKRMSHITVVLSEQRKFEARNSKHETKGKTK